MTSCLDMTRFRSGAGVLIARFYRWIYRTLCGEHPNLRPWHFQWLSGSILYRSVPPRLGRLTGDILDVGCGEQPYRRWVTGARRYVGLDVVQGPSVDIVVAPGERWPLSDHQFDGVLCTQVIEHVAALEWLLAEIARTVRPGGLLVLSVPFIYNEHGREHDYRRLSRHGVRALLEPEFDVEEIVSQGAVGSTLGAMLLAWIELSFTASGARTAVLLVSLPMWIALSALVNAAGWLLDRVDRTGAFYGNVLITARRSAG